VRDDYDVVRATAPVGWFSMLLFSVVGSKCVSPTQLLRFWMNRVRLAILRLSLPRSKHGCVYHFDTVHFRDLG
ncbi:hypothetical protein PFISCL1PPCAC_22094, partial [Pristionchus fissidentatus]